MWVHGCGLGVARAVRKDNRRVVWVAITKIYICLRSVLELNKGCRE